MTGAFALKFTWWRSLPGCMGGWNEVIAVRGRQGDSLTHYAISLWWATISYSRSGKIADWGFKGA